MTVRVAKVGRALVVVAAALVAAAAAQAGPTPVTGGVYTTVDQSVDGTGHCFNGNPSVNCNQYSAKQYVWLNGGPNGAKLGPDGQWFFAVLNPGGQPNPNDGASDNLSSPNDLYTNRTFTISNGVIPVGGYTGTHKYDSANGMINLMMYNNTSNSGGVYIMAVCSLANGYPVSASSCKYDAFKVTTKADTTPPQCTLTLVGLNTSGQKYIQVTTEDSGAGLENIVVDNSYDTNVSIPNWYTGDNTNPQTVTATKINQSLGAFVKLTVTDVGGNTTVCDPYLPPTRQHHARHSIHHRPGAR